MSEAQYLHAFNMFTSVGPKTLLRINNSFNSYSDAWSASQTEFERRGFKGKFLKDLHGRGVVDVAKEFKTLGKMGISVLSHTEPEYPKDMKQITDYPVILYYRGDIEVLSLAPLLAVVGTRATTTYGRQVTKGLVSRVASAGIPIVSGMALGVDRLAHEACLDAGQKTIAVLACGIDDDSLYPPSNRNFARRIIDNGIIISEFPPKTPALRHHFPMRNRIISGIAHATLVTEAALKSGSLITAKHALDQNKDVLTVPGPITSKQSHGTNYLLKHGAHMVQSANDVLEVLDAETRVLTETAKKEFKGTKEEVQILEVVGHEASSLDKIVKLCKMEASQVTSTVTLMEMKGMIEDVGGGVYSLKQ